MIGVDVSRNLENKTGKFRLLGDHLTFFCMYGTGGGSNLNKTVEQFLPTKIILSRTETDRCTLSLQICFYIKFGIYTFYQFQITA